MNINFSRFSEVSIKILMLAQEESRRFGHNWTGCEQLLMGIVGEKHSQVAQLLIAEGLTVESVRHEMEQLIGKGSGFVAVEIPLTPELKRVFHQAEAVTNPIAKARGFSPNTHI